MIYRLVVGLEVCLNRGRPMSFPADYAGLDELIPYEVCTANTGLRTVKNVPSGKAFFVGNYLV